MVLQPPPSPREMKSVPQASDKAALKPENPGNAASADPFYQMPVRSLEDGERQRLDQPHRWSGWPGAWCLDCGCDDPFEIAMAAGKWDLDEAGEPVFNPPIVCKPCPEPGSRRCDPYALGDKSRKPLA